MSSSGETRPPPDQGMAPVAAAFVCGIEALLLLALIGAYAVGIAHGSEASLARALSSAAMFLIGATLLAAMARGWRSGARWPRMATLVVNALLIPVSISVTRGNGLLIGLPLLLLAVAGVVAAIRAGGPEE